MAETPTRALKRAADRDVASEALVSSGVNPLLSTVLNTEVTLDPLVDGGSLPAPPNLDVTNHPVQVGATQLQQTGINDKGVTIAVLDSGIRTGGSQKFSSRILGSVDVVAGGAAAVTSDPFG